MLILVKTREMSNPASMHHGAVPSFLSSNLPPKVKIMRGIMMANPTSYAKAMSSPLLIRVFEDSFSILFSLFSTNKEYNGQNLKRQTTIDKGAT